MTSIETKALCSLFRKTEMKGTEALVDLMIDLCDAQSGLLMQDLWKWWQQHKKEDSLKKDVVHAPIKFDPDLWPKITPHSDLNSDLHPYQDPYVYDPNRSLTWTPTTFPKDGKISIIC